MKPLKTLFAATLLATLATGCAKVGRFNITIEGGPDLKSTVTVDLVAVPETKDPVWRKIDMDKYANPNPDRTEAQASGRMKTFELDATRRSFTLNADDPIYTNWIGIEGKPNLYVMTNLTNDGTRPVGDGVLDFRRMILPLNPKAWTDNNIKITVRPSGLYLEKDPKSGYVIK